MAKMRASISASGENFSPMAFSFFPISLAAAAFDPHLPPVDKERSEILPIAVGSLAVILFVGVYWWFNRHSKIILQKWADENGLQIMQKEQHYLSLTGAFKWWTNSRNQIVYSLKVRDREGHERSGWVRCGSYLGGVFFSDKIEVRWDQV